MRSMTRPPRPAPMMSTRRKAAGRERRPHGRALSQRGTGSASTMNNLADGGAARAECVLWVGSASSADRTADVPAASEVDQGRKTVSDCFGERAHSSGRRPMAAVL